MFEVLFENNDLLVINKPAGLVCHPTKGDEYSSLISRVRLYLGAEAPCHLVNRLDRETSGVTLVAKSSQAAGELGKLWEKRVVQKEYLAIVHGTLREPHGEIALPLGKDVFSEIAVKDRVRLDGTPARTEYRVERHFHRDTDNFTLVRLILHTGRKHQIRIHLAAIGHPVVGDKLYGGDEDLYMALVQDRLTNRQRARLIMANQALHAESLSFKWRDQDWAFHAKPDQAFAAFIA